jgi:hypothetical protein
VLGVLLAILLWRVLPGKGFARAASEARRRLVRGRGGAHDPFNDITQRIARKGMPRLATETAHEWVQRIAPRFDAQSRSQLEALLRWHYRERFDPVQMHPAERQAYAAAALGWCQRDPTPIAHESGGSETVQAGTNGVSPHRNRERG